MQVQDTAQGKADKCFDLPLERTTTTKNCPDPPPVFAGRTASVVV